MNRQEVLQAVFTVFAILLVAAGLLLAASQQGQTVAGVPLFGICVAAAFLLNWLAFIPAILLQTETFFDLVGALTNISVVSLALLLSETVSLRDWLLWGMIVIWAVRLGYFLFRRVWLAGHDSRFVQLKKSAPRFLVTWTLQGLWVTFIQAAALAAMTGVEKRPFSWVAALGLLIWLVGFIIEVVADRQKSAFRALPVNRERFIQSGLWAWSRHPNYFGEIVLWLGVAIMALPALRGWQWVTLLSPIFVIVLLTRISGIPLLQRKADKKWGSNPAYEAYKASTPLLIPRRPQQ